MSGCIPGTQHRVSNFLPNDGDGEQGPRRIKMNLFRGRRERGLTRGRNVSQFLVSGSAEWRTYGTYFERFIVDGRSPFFFFVVGI